MNLKINAQLVQSTNDASIVSKCSTVHTGYIKDNYIEFFVDKKKRRAPLLHLGYYSRMIILEKTILKFLQFCGIGKKQIISCGAGFDTLYWRLNEFDPSRTWSLVEVDFPDLIKKKLIAIKSSPPLTISAELWIEGSNLVKFNENYLLAGCDLSNLVELESILSGFVDFDLPTLFISECAVTYMHRKDSDNLFSWISGKFRNGAVINYEQIYPNDGFGIVMMNHFENIGSSLRSVSTYPTVLHHVDRFRSLGFASSWATDEWALFCKLLSPRELDIALELEQFDEFEELHSKCTHYVTSFAGSGSLSSWWQSYVKDDLYYFPEIPSCVANSKIIEGPPQLYGHSLCQNGSTIYVSGGLNVSGKSCTIHIITTENEGSVPLTVPEAKGAIGFDAVHGSSVFLPHRKDGGYLLFYGGRISPQKVWNNGCVKVFSTDGELMPFVDNSSVKPTPRYRTPLVLLASNEKSSTLFLFGGRTSDLSVKLNDFWRLTITYDTFKMEWTELNSSFHVSARMSHGLVAYEDSLYLSCGLDSCCYKALNDIWKWNISDSTWQQMESVGRIFPRYGHTSHIINDTLYLIGGVSTIHGPLPFVTSISLLSYSIQNIHIQVSPPRIFLPFNHTSVVTKNKHILIIGGGGKCFSFGTHLNKDALLITL